MKILLLNAGSSSLKCSLVDETQDQPIAHGLADWAGVVPRYEYVGPDGVTRKAEVSSKSHGEPVRRFLFDLTNTEPVALRDPSTLSAVGHRVVHGGPFSTSVRITPETRSQIAALSELAPLHNPPSLEALAAAEAELPDIPQIAVFDTAFHATLPPEAWTYPIPQQWTRDWGIRRYGFHGLSHSYCIHRAAELLGRDLSTLRLVICHLGHGCSAAVVQGGRCIDTTMGFTPLDGLMMGTRSGSIDPSIVLHVQERHGLSAEQVEKALNRESGLLGVSGISGDMRQVLAAGKSGDPQAQLAVTVYTHRIRKEIGAAVVTLGGIDALVFTAGVGEHSAEIRESVCARLQCVGLELDPKLNASCQADIDIATRSSAGRILVIETREDATMLQEVERVLRQLQTRPSISEPTQ